MYFDKSTKTLCEGIEPFSLRALAISKGRTAQISEVTPKLFEDGQEVHLRTVHKDILDEFKTKSKYRKYFSAWIVVGASWNISERRYYYMIRQRFAVFVWVTEDQIQKVPTTQIQLVKGLQQERYRPRVSRFSDHGWNREQQSLDSVLQSDKSQTHFWEAGSCERKLRERLKRR